jgi:murein DD-endopeptidase MepM/ murein hydrolase activator NlpD
VGAAMAATPPGRDLLGASGWWLTSSEAPDVALKLPEGVARGVVEVGVDVAPVPSFAYAEATIDGQPLAPGPSIAIDTRQLKDGDHLLRVAVQDGSLRRNTRWVEATLKSDNTPPQVAIETKPLAGVQGRTTLLQVRSNEPAQISVSPGAGPPIYFVEEAGAYVALLGNDPTVPPGPRPLKLLARDLAGNETTVNATLEVARGAFLNEQIVLNPDLLKYLTSGQYDQELKLLDEYYSNSGNVKLWDAAFDQPVRGVISSGYGIDRTYNGGVAKNRHLGTDFDVPNGTPVSAVAKGKVVFAQQLEVRGNGVIVDHGVGVHSAYYHLSRLDVKPGDMVNRGQALGLSGATGMVTGPHLHLEIRIAGVAVDPMEWLRSKFL